MVSKVLDSITLQLGKTFGMDYKYYLEDVSQGLIKPCFTVDSVHPMERSRSKVLYDRTIPIVVHYFHDDKTNVKREGYKIAEQVIEYLEYLPFENTTLRGEDISWQFVEDVLQIFITYKFITKRVTTIEDEMENLTESVSHK